MSTLSRLARATVAATAVLSLATGTAGCSPREPTIPSDQAATYDQLVGKDGQDFLDRISGYEWDDKGAAAAASLTWIGRDARSTDPQTATKAGQAAHTIAVYLSKDGHEQIGQRNPELVRGYAFALGPYQGPMISDENGTRGFESLTPAGDYAPPRRVFAAIETDTEAGKGFTETAYETADTYFGQFAAAITHPEGPGSPGLTLGAQLSGIVEGSVDISANRDIPIRTFSESRTAAAYFVATAMDAKPGRIDAKFFDHDRLRPPKEIPDSDLISYSDQVFGYVSSAPQIGLAFGDFFAQYQSGLKNG